MNNYQTRIIKQVLDMHSSGAATVTRLYWSPDATPGYIDIGVGRSKLYVFEKRVEGVYDGGRDSGRVPTKVELKSTADVLEFCREVSNR